MERIRLGSMANMDRSHHPAWREVIFPYLEDQHELDQLYCSSKLFQHLIVTKVGRMLCWCRPMDSIIKTAGIYPSYIAQMSQLRSLTVRLEPRLEHTWENYSTTEANAGELFSAALPTNLEYFEHDVNNVGWDLASLPDQQRAVVFDWLDKFPNLTLGPLMKHYLSFTLRAQELNVIKFHLDWLRYQYVTALNISFLRTLWSLLVENGDIGLTERFLNGIINLTLYAPTAETVANTLNVVNVPYDPSDPYQALYYRLPHLEAVSGPADSLPDGLVVYSSIFAAPAEGSIPVLPNSLLRLSVKWPVFNLAQLQFPHSLTTIRIDGVSASYFPVETFPKLIQALPRGLQSLTMNGTYLASETQNYWSVDNILALPRGLKSCHVIPYIWEDFEEPLVNERISALPPRLTSLWMRTDGKVDLHRLMLLPRTLTNMTVILNSNAAPTIGQFLDHFSQLKILDLRVNLSTYFTFPELLLPSTLETFIMNVTVLNQDTGNVVWEVPLQKIHWPDSMRLISINALEYLLPVISTSQWNLPRRLTELSLDNIKINALPFSWPEGLRSFTCEVKQGYRNQSIARVWPDISRMAYYFPDSSVCYSAIYDDTDLEEHKTIILTRNPITKRPQIGFDSEQ